MTDAPLLIRSPIISPIIVPEITPVFEANAVTFDGSNDVSKHDGALTGGVAGTVLLASVFVRLNALNINQVILGANVTDQPIEMRIASSNRIFISVRPAAGGGSTANIIGPVLTTGQWYHILITLDTNSLGNTRGYLDGVEMIYNQRQANTGNIGWDGTNWAVGNRHDVSVNFANFDISELYATNELLDITVQANRDKFLKSDGTPEDLGSDGSTPTGTQPLIYMSGDAAAWNAGINKGSGGNFVMSGAVTDSANEPVDISP